MIKNIGIVTYYNALNNGAFLQALAINSFLEQHGFDVSFINTKEDFSLPKLANTNELNYWHAYKKKLEECHSMLKQTERSSFDAIIYGSDEIWNLNGHGKNPLFWGYKLTSKNKIAYAACAGGIGLKHMIKYPFTIWGILTKFKAISVRDIATKKLVSKFYLKSISECLDPTFLGDFTKYRKENLRGDYIVIYSYSLKKETVKQIKKFASIHNCKTIFTGSYSDWADENPILDPIEWLSLMYNAKYVFTSTFHGSVFSIICKKEFYVVDTNTNKVHDLLYRLNLTDRLINNFEHLPYRINYEEVDKKIEKIRISSKKFLLSNLNYNL